jgi:hypothetical protein
MEDKMENKRKQKASIEKVRNFLGYGRHVRRSSEVIKHVMNEQSEYRQSREAGFNIEDMQKESLLFLANSLWGPRYGENDHQDWSMEKFKTDLVVTNGKEYFMAYPHQKLDLSEDWTSKRPPVCRMYVEKDNNGKINELLGYSGPIYTPDQVGTGVEEVDKTMFEKV